MVLSAEDASSWETLHNEKRMKQMEVLVRSKRQCAKKGLSLLGYNFFAIDQKGAYLREAKHSDGKENNFEDL